MLESNSLDVSLHTAQRSLMKRGDFFSTIKAAALQAAVTMNSERPWLASADSQAGVTTKFRHAPHGETWAFAKQCIWLWHSLSAGAARLVLLNLPGGLGGAGYPRWFPAGAEKIHFSPSGVLHKHFALPGWPLNSSSDLHVTSCLSRRLYHISQFVNKRWAAFLSLCMMMNCMWGISEGFRCNFQGSYEERYRVFIAIFGLMAFQPWLFIFVLIFDQNNQI